MADDDKKEEKKEDEAKPSNIIQMAGDILGLKPKSDDEKKAEEEKKDEKKAEESNPSKSNLVSIMSDVLKPKPKPRKERKPLDNPEKLKAITDVTKLLNELKVDPPFPMPWLMLYLNELNNLGADDEVKSAFNRWAWDALQDANANKDDDSELGSVPPSIMIQLANDLAPKEEKDKDKEKEKDKEDKDKDGKEDKDKDGKEDKPAPAKLTSKPRSDRDTAKV